MTKVYVTRPGKPLQEVEVPRPLADETKIAIPVPGMAGVRDIRPMDFRKREDLEVLEERVDQIARKVNELMPGGRDELGTAAVIWADVMRLTLGRNLDELYGEFRSKIKPPEGKEGLTGMLEREASYVAVRGILKAWAGDSFDELKAKMAKAIREHRNPRERIYCVKLFMTASRINALGGEPSLEALGVSQDSIAEATGLERVYTSDSWQRPKASAADVILAARYVDVGEEKALDDALKKNDARFEVSKLSRALNLSGTDAHQKKTLPQVAQMIKRAVWEKLTGGESMPEGIAMTAMDYETTQKGLIKWMAGLLGGETLDTETRRRVELELHRHEARVITRKIAERIIADPTRDLKKMLESGIRPLEQI
ncbi:MAG: hypothetical protein FJY77_04920 [Candidatus Altiarchaeales archaeon]|nr:hypothetical protein [Candidatus Altiarchaeales archaeon]